MQLPWGPENTTPGEKAVAAYCHGDIVDLRAVRDGGDWGSTLEVAADGTVGLDYGFSA